MPHKMQRLNNTHQQLQCALPAGLQTADGRKRCTCTLRQFKLGEIGLQAQTTAALPQLAANLLMC